MSTTNRTTKRRRAIEALLVVLIISTLLAVAYLPLATFYSDGWRQTCLFQLHEIGRLLLRYNVEKGAFPPAVVGEPDGKPSISWRVAILPYLFHNSNDIYGLYKFDEPWNGPGNQPLRKKQVTIYHCRSDPGSVCNTSYVAVVGASTLFGDDGATSVFRPQADANANKQGASSATYFDSPTRKTYEFVDGAANTIAIVETHASDIHWMEPRDMSLQDALKPINSKNSPCISSKHPPARTKEKGACVLYADGRSGFISEDIDPALLRTLLEIDNKDKPKAIYQPIPNRHSETP